jgi:hypothetical protein
LRVFPYR